MVSLLWNFTLLMSFDDNLEYIFGNDKIIFIISYYFLQNTGKKPILVFIETKSDCF